MANKMDQILNQQHLQQFKDEQLKRLDFNVGQTELWKKYKDDYLALEERLLTLPDKVSHQVMVPFGKLAMVPGRLVHTNEVLVLLGDNWFAERSAKQAASICRRRMEHCDTTLARLDKERSLLNSWLEQANVLKEEGLIEIAEAYDEEEERRFYERRKERARQKQLEKMRVEQNELEYFEKMEKIEREQGELEEENNNQVDREEQSNADSEVESEYDEDSEDTVDEEEDDEQPDKNTAEEPRRRVSFATDSPSDGETLHINFSHSKTEAAPPGTSSEINSPADIYRVYSHLFNRKPILKNHASTHKTPFQALSGESTVVPTDMSMSEDNASTSKVSHEVVQRTTNTGDSKPVPISDISERNVTNTVGLEEEKIEMTEKPKTVSRFMASKMKNKS